MKIIEKSIEINELYVLYQDLLTAKQKVYFESYYFNDYSITEISENQNVSRNAVHDLIRRTVKKLYDFESKLLLNEKDKKRQVIVEKLKLCNDAEEAKLLALELEKVE
ncbi:hypothetical protein OAO42_00190 [Candidatus Izimaplasma bacterium]|nr:hypothetical protein [Candidatus Izimaplasma bacterium]